MFDLDGTLADTGRDLANAVNHIRTRLNLRPLENRLIYAYVGRGVEHLIRNALPEKGEKRFKEVMDLFLEYYGNHLLDTTVLYPHVEETLKYFKEKKKVVISNKLQSLTVEVLEGLGIAHCFDAILGGDSAEQKKPDPAPLNQVLAKLQIAATRALIVGDGDTDILAGKEAGVHTCAVTYGLGRKEDLVAAQPDLLIDDLQELVEHFC